VVSAHFDTNAGLGRIVLRPNQSWSWRSNTYFVGTLLIISLIIGVAFAAHGYWLVLPFGAIEMGALFACLYYCTRRASQQEVLIFSDVELIVEKGHRRPEQVYRYPRFFARFVVESPPYRWYQPRIAVLTRGQRLEIGAFLGADEKRDLIAQLRTMVHTLGMQRLASS